MTAVTAAKRALFAISESVPQTNWTQTIGKPDAALWAISRTLAANQPEFALAASIQKRPLACTTLATNI
jgi:hypothetical protein